MTIGSSRYSGGAAATRVASTNSEHHSVAPLSLLLPMLPDKHVVGDGIPGVMNANEEQQQRRGANAEKCLANIQASRIGRSGQRCIGRERQQDMKQPVLELG